MASVMSYKNGIGWSLPRSRTRRCNTGFCRLSAPRILHGRGLPISGTEPFVEAAFPNRLFFPMHEGKKVTVGMVFADVRITAPDGLEPDRFLPALVTCRSPGHDTILMETPCRYVFSVPRVRPGFFMIFLRQGPGPLTTIYHLIREVSHRHPGSVSPFSVPELPDEPVISGAEDPLPITRTPGGVGIFHGNQV